MAWRWRVLGILVLVAWCSGFGLPIEGDAGGADGGAGVPRPRLVDDTFVSSSPGMNTGNVISCKRYIVPASSRLESFRKLAHVRRVNVSAPFTLSKIEACVHSNATLELCQCSKEKWKTLEKNKWSASMSPFEDMYVDIRSDRKASIKDTLVTVLVKEEFCSYRVFFFVLGIALLISAPIVSEWVPFYYSSGMTLGILLVVLIILFQAMKLLPFGRKSSIYILLYGTLVGFGALILRQISILLTPMLTEMGLGEDMVRPIALLCLMGVLTVGAYMGYWGVRKFILTTDGDVDSGTATFVKWALRLFGATMLLQTSADPVFSVLTLIVGILISLVPFKGLGNLFYVSWPFTRGDSTSSAFDAWRYRKKHVKLWKKKQVTTSPFGVPSSSYHTPVTISGKRVFVSPPATFKVTPERTFYSTFHHTPERNKMTRAEIEDLTREYTHSSMKELLSSPKFAEWAIENTDRIAVLPHNTREERPEDEIELTASLSS